MEAKTNNETKRATKTVTKKTVKAPKKFKNDDLIECRSITNGELLMVGDKTKYLYKWADYGDIEQVEYQDLLYDTRSNSSQSNTMRPRFIVLDEDFISQNKALNEVYKKFYGVNDLKELILNTDANELVSKLPEYPLGIQESIKGLAATLIEEGALDSISKVKVLDKYFDTNLLLTLKN